MLIRSRAYKNALLSTEHAKTLT